MSKFYELVSIYQADRQFYHSYEQISFRFAQLLSQAIRDFYTIPEGNFFYIGKEDQQQTVPNLADTLDMDDKGFWHIRYGFNLPYDLAQPQGQGFLLIFEILFKKLNGRFVVRMLDEEDFFVAFDENDTHFDSFLHYLHDFLSRFLDNRFERFLNGEDTQRTSIGFRIHEKES